jgi:hypothetical protein
MTSVQTRASEPHGSTSRAARSTAIRGSIQCHELNAASNWTEESDEKSSNRLTATRARPDTLDSAMSARAAEGSIAVTSRPRSTNGSVAIPVPAPISIALSPRVSPVDRTMSSNTLSGYRGRNRSYASAWAANLSEALPATRQSSDTSPSIPSDEARATKSGWQRLGGLLSAIEVIGGIVRSTSPRMVSTEKDEGNKSHRNPQQPRVLESSHWRPELLVDTFCVGIGSLWRCCHRRYAVRDATRRRVDGFGPRTP